MSLTIHARLRQRIKLRFIVIIVTASNDGIVSAMRPYIGIVHFERIVQLRPLLRDQRSKTEVSRLSDGSPYRVWRLLLT